MRSVRRAAAVAIVALAAGSSATPAVANAGPGLWKVYDEALSRARYIDLTHAITPNMPVWKGFGAAMFDPSVDPATGRAYTYAKDGFEATAYRLATDQFGRSSIRPRTGRRVPGHRRAARDLRRPAARRHLDRRAGRQEREVRAAGRRHQALRAAPRPHPRRVGGHDPLGLVEAVDRPPGAGAGARRRPGLPGVSLDALKFLHLRRHILFHGHEPLDTDTTPTLVGEDWLMHHGFTQAEGVANLAGVPATGCLVNIGYAKFRGGLGGYARYVAICPPSTHKGVPISRRDAPLPRYARPLRWDATLGYRVR